MKFWSKVTLATAAVALLSLSGVRLAGQAPAPGKAATQGKAQGKAETPAKAGPAKVTAGEFFKNVTTPTLKDLTPDDFILAMGLVADNLGLDCADCPPNAGTDKADSTNKQTVMFDISPCTDDSKSF